MEQLKSLEKQLEELRWKIHQAEQNGDPIEAAKLQLEYIDKKRGIQ